MQTLVLPHTLHTSVAKILWKASTCKERHRTMAHDSALLHSLFLTSSLSSELPRTPKVCDTPLYLVKEQSHCKLTVLRLSNLLFSTHHTLLFSNLLKTPSSLDHPISPYPSTLFWLHFALPVQFSSVAQLYPTLCNPMDCSMPGLPVHHQFPEFTQTHVHWIGDAIQPSHPLSSPSPSSHLQSFPASGSFQMSQFFASGGQSIGVSASASASALPFNQLKFHVLLFYFIYLSIFGHAGSSLLHGATLCTVHGLLIVVASRVAGEHWLWVS